MLFDHRHVPGLLIFKGVHIFESLDDKEYHEDDVETSNDVQRHTQRDAAAACHLILNHVKVMERHTPVETFFATPVYASFTT